MQDQTIQRIQLMEFYFDTLRDSFLTAPHSIRESKFLMAMLEALTRYYEDGQWLADYSQDEQGMLPKELKRGVLSQDALYDLLSDISQQ